MRYILLLTIILLSSCENNKERIIKKQQAIKNEMAEVNAFYYKKIDSLDRVKKVDTNTAKLNEIAVEISSTDSKRISSLLTLQKVYDSLEATLKKQ